MWDSGFHHLPTHIVARARDALVGWRRNSVCDRSSNGRYASPRSPRVSNSSRGTVAASADRRSAWLHCRSYPTTMTSGSEMCAAGEASAKTRGLDALAPPRGIFPSAHLGDLRRRRPRHAAARSDVHTFALVAQTVKSITPANRWRWRRRHRAKLTNDFDAEVSGPTVD